MNHDGIPPFDPYCPMNCFGCPIKCPAKQGVKYPLDGVSK